MKRFVKAVFSVIAAVSLLLASSLFILWGRSYHAADALLPVTNSVDGVTINTAGGEFLVDVITADQSPYDHPVPYHWLWDISQRPLSDVRPWDYDSGYAGFGIIHETIQVPPDIRHHFVRSFIRRFTRVCLPLWFVVGVLLIPPAIWVIGFVRPRKGQGSGFDVTTTGDQ